MPNGFGEDRDQLAERRVELAAFLSCLNKTMNLDQAAERREPDVGNDWPAPQEEANVLGPVHQTGLRSPIQFACFIPRQAEGNLHHAGAVVLRILIQLLSPMREGSPPSITAVYAAHPARFFLVLFPASGAAAGLQKTGAVATLKVSSSLSLGPQL
ncbi:hypothetical protein V6R86_00360 [Sphingomonas kaistensis]|uniref:Uncharacterized protein n=1 Tax=Sphingomonas kaistensis TaxID=298708 RepID=A0ABZ2FWH2_9SPHN